ncbi:MAG: hypothetical protein J7J80_00840 [Thermotogae bacterium]|nr:hypothetical protein [Thermotogota bacterium]
MRKLRILILLACLVLLVGVKAMGFDLLGKYSYDVDERIRFVVDTYNNEFGTCFFKIYQVETRNDPLGFFFSKTEFKKKLLQSFTSYLREWSYNELPVGKLPVGLYEAEVAFKGETKRWKFSVTSIRGYYLITEKEALFVFDKGEGYPLKGARLYLCNEDGPVFLGESGNDGTLPIPINALKEIRYRDRILVLGNGQVNVFSFSAWLPRTEEMRTGIRAFVLTDRPVYKPGDEIRLKIFLRKITEDSYTYARLKHVTVSLFDPLGNRVFQKHLPNVEGSISLEVSTSPEWRIGSYKLVISGGNFQETEWINVLHYVKPAYSGEVEVPEDIYASNLIFTVRASYHFGAPVSGGWTKVNVFDREEDELIFSGEGILSDEGEKTFVVQTKGIKSVTEIDVEAYVWDESGVEVKAHGKTTYHPTEYEIRIKMPESVDVGSTVSCNLFGDTARTLRYVVRKWGDIIASGEVMLREGKGTFDFTVESPGLYDVEIWDNDLIVAKKRLYTSHWMRYSKKTFSNILPEKNVVRPGEEIEFQFSGEGALYVDVVAGSKVEHVFLGSKRNFKYKVPRTCNKDSLDVYATFVHDGIDYDMLSINVIREKPVYSLSIVPSKEVYKPGEEARLFIKNMSGDTVDMALSVVDKPIVELFGESWNNLAESVYPEDPTFSEYELTQRFWLERYSERTTVYETALATTKEEALGIPEAPQSLRERFEDVALWLPNLKVDDSIVVTFKLPDNLTTWYIRGTGMGEASVTDGSTEIRVSKELTLRAAPPEFLVEGDKARLPIMIRNDSPIVQSLEILLGVAGKTSERELLLKPSESVTLPLEVEATTSGKLEITAWASSDSLFDGEKREIQVLDRYLQLSYYDSGMGLGHPVVSTYEYPAYSFDHRVKISLIPDMAELLYEAIEGLVTFPYGCTEQTMSSFLPAIAVRKLGVLKSPLLEKIDEITRAGLNRLYGYQHGDGGWGWWKNDDSDIFMTSYVLLGMKYLLDEGVEIIPDSLKRGLRWLAENFDTSSDWKYWFAAYVLSFYTTLPEDVASRPAQDAPSVVFKALTLGDHELIEEIKREYVTESGHLAWIESEDWFANEVLLTSVFITALEDNDPMLSKMLNYLLSKRRGISWQSTKDTAFVVLGLSRFIERSERFVSLKVNGSTVFAQELSHTLELEMNAATKTTVEITGDTDRLIYSISYLYKSEYIPKELKSAGTVKALSRKIRRVVRFQYYKGGQSGEGIILIPIRSEYSIKTIKQLEEIPEVSNLKTNRDIWKLEENGTIYYRGWETGLMLEGSIIYKDETTAFATGSLYQKHSGRLLGEGVHQLEVRKLDPLKVGDILAHVITVHQDGGDYYVLEDPLPASAMSLEDFREPIIGIYDKFGWYEYESWWTRREFRREKVVYFFRGWESENRYVHFYRLRFPGTFTVLPTRVWNMYDPASAGYSDTVVIQVQP